MSLSTGLLLTLTAVNLPAFSQSQPATSPSSAANSGDRFSNNPVLRGVTLTSNQKSQLLKIEADSAKRIKQMLTPAQRKLVMTNPGAVQLTEPQKKKYMTISKDIDTKIKAVLTPEQLKQVQANAQALRGGNGQSPSASPSPSSSPK